VLTYQVIPTRTVGQEAFRKKTGQADDRQTEPQTETSTDNKGRCKPTRTSSLIDPPLTLWSGGLAVVVTIPQLCQCVHTSIITSVHSIQCFTASFL